RRADEFGPGPYQWRGDFMKRLSRTFLASLAALAGLSGLARADGELDPAFGIGGKVTTAFGVPAATATSVVLQPDGKIVAAGWLVDETANIDFALARYKVAGDPDHALQTGRNRAHEP